MVELTVCFESNFVDASKRKAAKYHHLLEEARSKGYKAQLITLQVGSRGVPDMEGFELLGNSLSLSQKELIGLLEDSSRLTLVGSFSIWCSRNKSP